MTNFRIKWRKCGDLQHFGCWNLVCSIILVRYKKYMRGFWKFSFFGHLSGSKFDFGFLWPKIGFQPTQNGRKIRIFKIPAYTFVTHQNDATYQISASQVLQIFTFLSFYAKICHFYYKGRFPIFLAHLKSRNWSKNENRWELRCHWAHYGN